MKASEIDFKLIHNMINEGMELNQIHEKTGISMSYLFKNYSCFYVSTKSNRLGHKDEPYYKSEKEMLEDKVYTYESLSPSEKAIYDETAGL